MAEPEPYCEHCQLPLFMCQHGKRRGPSVVRQAGARPVDWALVEELAEQSMSADGRPFEASYGGRCCCCGDRWEPGDQVAWSADDGTLAHAECVHG